MNSARYPHAPAAGEQPTRPNADRKAPRRGSAELDTAPKTSPRSGSDRVPRGTAARTGLAAPDPRAAATLSARFGQWVGRAQLSRPERAVIDALCGDDMNVLFNAGKSVREDRIPATLEGYDRALRKHEAPAAAWSALIQGLTCGRTVNLDAWLAARVMTNPIVEPDVACGVLDGLLHAQARRHEKSDDQPVHRAAREVLESILDAHQSFGATLTQKQFRHLQSQLGLTLRLAGTLHLAETDPRAQERIDAARDAARDVHTGRDPLGEFALRVAWSFTDDPGALLHVANAAMSLVPAALTQSEELMKIANWWVNDGAPGESADRFLDAALYGVDDTERRHPEARLPEALVHIVQATYDQPGANGHQRLSILLLDLMRDVLATAENPTRVRAAWTALVECLSSEALVSALPVDPGPIAGVLQRRADTEDLAAPGFRRILQATLAGWIEAGKLPRRGRGHDSEVSTPDLFLNLLEPATASFPKLRQGIDLINGLVGRIPARAWVRSCPPHSCGPVEARTAEPSLAERDNKGSKLAPATLATPSPATAGGVGKPSASAEFGRYLDFVHERRQEASAPPASPLNRPEPSAPPASPGIPASPEIPPSPEGPAAPA